MRTFTKQMVPMAIAALAIAPIAASAQGMQPPMMGRGMAPPFAGGGQRVTLAQAVTLAPQQDKSLVPLSNAYNAANTRLKKSPKDAAAKRAYVDATYKFAHAAEYSQTLSPRIKYRAALALYQRALVADPHHGPSLAEKKNIEDIYRSMPGGIPKQ